MIVPTSDLYLFVYADYAILANDINNLEQTTHL